MNKTESALKRALEALDQYTNVVASVNNPDAWVTVVDAGKPAREAITAIKEALAQPEQEPLACPYCKNSATLGAVYYDQNCFGCVKRMTAPLQRTWVGLTDSEFSAIYDSSATTAEKMEYVEAKLKEKNT